MKTAAIPAASDQADRAFAEALQRREPDALARFFDTWFDRVYGYVRRLVPDEHLAEDLTQEVFLSIHRALERYDPSRELEPWVFTIATNKVRDHWRSKGHRRSKDDGSLEGDGFEEWLPAGDERPETPLEDEELRAVVRDAVEELPEGMRDTVEMRAYEGRPFEAIGAALGRNAEAVRKRYSRALAVLREALRPHCTTC